MTNEERKAKRDAFRKKWEAESERAILIEKGLNPDITYSPPETRRNYTELIDEALVNCMEAIQHFHPDCVQMEVVMLKEANNVDPDYDNVTRAIRLFRKNTDGVLELIDSPEFKG